MPKLTRTELVMAAQCSISFPGTDFPLGAIGFDVLGQATANQQAVPLGRGAPHLEAARVSKRSPSTVLAAIHAMLGKREEDGQYLYDYLLRNDTKQLFIILFSHINEVKEVWQVVAGDRVRVASIASRRFFGREGTVSIPLHENLIGVKVDEEEGLVYFFISDLEVA